MFENVTFMVAITVAILAVIILAKTALIVPQQSAFVVESLGKYSRTLRAGFHILIPFIERAAYKHSLKELAFDIAEQICITKDNVQVGVDGVLYLQVLDAERASYGITDYVFAISQLAQTTLRSEIGRIDLDRTFEERGAINGNGWPGGGFDRHIATRQAVRRFGNCGARRLRSQGAGCIRNGGCEAGTGWCKN